MPSKFQKVTCANPLCEAEFYTAKGGSPTRYCSDPCREYGKRKTWREQFHKRPKREPQERPDYKIQDFLRPLPPEQIPLEANFKKSPTGIYYIDESRMPQEACVRCGDLYVTEQEDFTCPRCTN